MISKHKFPLENIRFFLYRRPALDIDHDCLTRLCVVIHEVSEVVRWELGAAPDYLIFCLEMLHLIYIDCRDDLVLDLQPQVRYLSILKHLLQNKIVVALSRGVEPYPVDTNFLAVILTHTSCLLPHRSQPSSPTADCSTTYTTSHKSISGALSCPRCSQVMTGVR